MSTCTDNQLCVNLPGTFECRRCPNGSSFNSQGVCSSLASSVMGTSPTIAVSSSSPHSYISSSSPHSYTPSSSVVLSSTPVVFISTSPPFGAAQNEVFVVLERLTIAMVSLFQFVVIVSIIILIFPSFLQIFYCNHFNEQLLMLLIDSNLIAYIIYV